MQRICHILPPLNLPVYGTSTESRLTTPASSPADAHTCAGRCGPGCRLTALSLALILLIRSVSSQNFCIAPGPSFWISSKTCFSSGSSLSAANCSLCWGLTLFCRQGAGAGVGVGSRVGQCWAGV